NIHSTPFPLFLYTLHPYLTLLLPAHFHVCLYGILVLHPRTTLCPHVPLTCRVQLHILSHRIHRPRGPATCDLRPVPSCKMAYYRPPQSPPDEQFNSLSPPQRNPNRWSASMAGTNDARGVLTRRFTTNTVPTLSPIGQQRLQAAGDMQAVSPLQLAQLCTT
ncbi:hypothetical protein AC578_390, partial [Pseudocercospora eumusae]